MSQIDWTGRADFIRGKVEEGLNDKDIAALIPGATKSAVGGARRRMGISTNYAPTLRERVSVKGTHKPKQKPALPPKPPEPKAPTPKPEPVIDAEYVANTKGPLGSSFVPKPGARLIAFDHLKAVGAVNGTCRWPYEIEGETMYCGAATEKSFCPTHTRMAYTPSSIVSAEQERARRERTSLTVPVSEISRAQRFILSLRGANTR